MNTMSFSFFAIFVLMIMVAGAAGVVALIFLAIKHKRFGLLALAGGLVLLPLLMIALGFGVWFSYAQRGVSTVASSPHWVGGPITDTARAATQGLQRFHEYSDSGATFASGISIFKLLVFVGLAVLLGVAVFRRMHWPAAVCGGHRRLWPGLLAILLIAFLLFGTARFQVSRNYEGATAPMPQIAQMTVAHQQAMLAQRQALNEAKSRQLIARADIHDLMDKVDAPKIILPPHPAAPSASPPVASPPTAAAPSDLVKPAQASEKKPPKPKNESKSSNDAEAESDQTVAQQAEIDTYADQSSAKETASTAQTKSANTTSQKKKDSSQHERPKTVATPAVVAKETDETASTPPAWINNPPKRVGETWRDVVATDEYVTLEECYRDSDRLLLGAIFEHVQTLIGKSDLGGRSAERPAIVVDGNGRIPSAELQSVINYLRGLGITIDFIRSQIATKEYVATTERSVGPMKKLYTLVEFTPAVDRELMWRWSNFEREKRFAMVGIGAGSIFGLLTLVFGLLKIDTWTRGYYTKRLFIGLPAMIIGGCWLYTMLLRMGYPLPH